MYLVMFREVFEGALAEMFFWSYAPRFAVKARGCPGMAPWNSMKEATAAADASPNDRCLFCGLKVHRSTSDIHALEMAEGGLKASGDQLETALSNIAKDKSLSAE